MNTLTPSGVLSLSVAERIQLVEDIWDTIAEVPDEVGLTDSQKAEMAEDFDWYEEVSERHIKHPLYGALMKMS